MINYILNTYGNQALFGGGMELLNSYYDDALIKVVRHYDNVEVLVYPDSQGKVSLNSQILVGSLSSSAVNLGEFLCQPGYTRDNKVPSTLNVTAGVSIIYDQSPNQNNAVNTDTSTQFLISKNGNIIQTEFGLELITYYSLGKYMEISAINQDFSIHQTFTPEANYNAGTIVHKLIEDGAGNFKILTYVAYTDLAGAVSTFTGVESDTLLLIDEDYFRDRTTYTALESVTEKIVTIEATITDAAYDSTQTYTLGGGCGTFYTCVIYEDRGNATRRHDTNLSLSKNVANLSSQLVKFSPESFYNNFFGAAAIFATASLSGLNNDAEKKMLRVVRDSGHTAGSGAFASIFYDNASWSMEIDVSADKSGRISLGSPISNPQPYKSTNATTLGEFLNATGYDDVDNIGQTAWAYTVTWYDQSLNERQARYWVTKPILYNGDSNKFEPAVGDPSIIKALNFDYGGGLRASFNLTQTGDQVYSPRSLFFVYANAGTTAIQSLIGGYNNTGPGYYSRKPAIIDGNPGTAGFSIDGTLAYSSDLFEPSGGVQTLEGLNTNTQIVGISYSGVGQDGKIVINGSQEYNIVLLSDTFDSFNYIGAMYGYIQAIILYEENMYSQFPEIFSALNAFFNVEDNIFPEVDFDTSIAGLYGDVVHAYGPQRVTGLVFSIIEAKSGSNTFNVPPGLISKEVYNWDVEAIADTSDAQISKLYDQVLENTNPAFVGNTGTSLIKFYDGATKSMLRALSPTKVSIKPTAASQRFTRSSSISIPDNSCFYLVGIFPTGNCAVLGDGTTSLTISSGSFVLTTSAASYSTPTGLSAGDFFIARFDRSGTTLHVQTGDALSRGTIYQHEITSAETFTFDTLLAAGPSDTTQFTGEFFNLTVFEASKRSVGQDIMASFYSEYNVTAPAASSETPTTIAGSPKIASSTLTEGATSSTTAAETISNPSGLSSGDLFLVVVMSNSSNGPMEYEPPAGFTSIERFSQSLAIGTSIFYKIADGTEGYTSSFTVYNTSGTMYYNIWAARITGVDTSAPINIVGTTDNIDNSTTLDIPGITTTVNNTLLLAVATHKGSDGNTMSIESGWTAEQTIDAPNTSQSYGIAGIIGSKEFESAGATGTVTVTSVAGDDTFGVMFAIAPES